MKRLALITLLLAAAMQTAHAKPPEGYPNCLYDTKEACAADTKSMKDIREYARTHKEEMQRYAPEIQQALDNSKGYTVEYNPQPDYKAEMRDSVKQAQHFLDHYEPHTECQPSQVMSAADMQNQWAGISSGPQGMDCQTVYVPVYR